MGAGTLVLNARYSFVSSTYTLSEGDHSRAIVCPSAVTLIAHFFGLTVLLQRVSGVPSLKSTHCNPETQKSFQILCFHK